MTTGVVCCYWFSAADNDDLLGTGLDKLTVFTSVWPFVKTPLVIDP